MANEAVIIELPRNINPVMMTIADSGTIEKGTLLKTSDPNTAAASSARDEWGGIAAAEKVTLDGSTKLAVYKAGCFDLTCAATLAAAITIGECVTLSGANLIDAATEAEIQLGKFIGWAEEAGGNGEVIRVRLRGN